MWLKFMDTPQITVPIQVRTSGWEFPKEKSGIERHNLTIHGWYFWMDVMDDMNLKNPKKECDDWFWTIPKENKSSIKSDMFQYVSLAYNTSRNVSVCFFRLLS